MDGFEVTLMPTRVELMTFQCSLEELYRQDKWQPIALIYLRDRLAFTQSHPLGTALPGRSPGAHLAAVPGHPFLIFSSKPGSVCTWLMDLGLGHGFFFQQKRKWGFSAIRRADMATQTQEISTLKAAWANHGMTRQELGNKEKTTTRKGHEVDLIF